jgi:hypothetical protein
MFPRNAGKHLPVRQVNQAPNGIHERLAVSREKNAPHPAIGDIAPSLQPPAGFQTVKDSHETHRLNIGQLRQPHLTYSFVIVQIHQHFALG